MILKNRKYGRISKFQKLGLPCFQLPGQQSSHSGCPVPKKSCPLMRNYFIRDCFKKQRTSPIKIPLAKSGCKTAEFLWSCTRPVTVWVLNSFTGINSQAGSAVPSFDTASPTGPDQRGRSFGWTPDQAGSMRRSRHFPMEGGFPCAGWKVIGAWR